MTPAGLLKEKFWRIVTKSGGKKGPAVVAVADTLLRLIFQVLSTGEPYRDKQAPALEPQRRERMIRHHPRRLGKLGVALSSPRPAPSRTYKGSATVLGAVASNGAPKALARPSAAQAKVPLGDCNHR
jgi:hypothetical protein